MNTVQKIRDFLRTHPTEELFTCRDLLSFGTRSAVDNAIYDLVKSNAITRVARGVYSLASRTSPITVLEIASVKAKSFGRQIITHAAELAEKFGLLEKRESNDYYFTSSGRSSKFRFREFTIHFHGTCSRKFSLGDAPLGQALRTLCFLGKTQVKLATIKILFAAFDHHQLGTISAQSRLLPAWVADFFHTSSLNTGISCSLLPAYGHEIEKVRKVEEPINVYELRLQAPPLFPDHTKVQELTLERSTFAA